MLTKVDGHNGHTIFKVTNKKGKLQCYRIFPNDKLGDSSAATEVSTLVEARSKIRPTNTETVRARKSA